jgi:hypothetical protein
MLIYILLLILVPISLPITIISFIIKKSEMEKLVLSLIFSITFLYGWLLLIIFQIPIENSLVIKNVSIFETNKTIFFFFSLIFLTIIVSITLYYYYQLWIKRIDTTKKIKYMGLIQMLISVVFMGSIFYLKK